MYTEISTTKAESLRLVAVIDRQNVPSQFRSKAAAMGLGLALAKNLPALGAATSTDAATNYSQVHELEVRNYVGGINELTPIDARLTQLYAFKFYQTLHGVPFQALTDYTAATALGVAHALLGTELYFSLEDIAFMELYKEAVLKIAAAALPVLVTNV